MNKTNKIQMVGNQYGLLTVLYELEKRNKNGHIMYRVKCKCGKEKDVLGSSLRYMSSRSCNKCSLLTGSHGMYNTREFKIWQSMKNRCYNTNDPIYKNYGAKGISVCDRWKNSFKNFIEDMGLSNGLSIDRINVFGNYEPNNCRWANAKTQARNRTNNNVYTYKGKTLCVSEWCEILNMPTSTFNNRVIRGWDIEKIINTPIRQFIKDK